MKRKSLIISLLVLILIALPLFNAYDNTSIAIADEAQYGGTLRMIATGMNFPSVLGYPPEIGPSQQNHTRFWTERLNDWDKDGNLIPELAESWEQDSENLTLTWHLRQGVRFHDGTPFNAEAAKWNIEQKIEAKTLKEDNFIKSLEVVDEYTLVMHLTEFTCTQAIHYGWVPMFSPTAVETNGADWARMHAVGTGPFKVVKYERDSLIVLEKNEDYWREGPYLNRIEFRLIPDNTTAIVMMKAGEADLLLDIRSITTVLNLEKAGLKINWGPGIPMSGIMGFSTDPDIPFYDKRVREAVEYAIDRPAIAKLLGFGTFEPLTQMACSRMFGYNEGYDPRPYNPDMARQLLAEAAADGVFEPNKAGGFDTEILCREDTRELALTVKGYLEAVGIKAKIDIADRARFHAASLKDGWPGLITSGMAFFPDGSEYFEYFGPSESRSFRIGLYQSPEFLALWKKAIVTLDISERKKIMQQMTKQATEDCMMTLIYKPSVMASAMQKNVHSDHMLIHNITWFPHTWWIEK